MNQATSLMKSLNIGRSEKPLTSITQLIDRLCRPAGSSSEAGGGAGAGGKIDYEDLAALMHVIGSLPAGPQEALRAIRKKLKYGDVKTQMRAVTVLRVMIDNDGDNLLKKTLCHDPLLERLATMASESMTPEGVKMALNNLFKSWYLSFKNEPSLRELCALYESSGVYRKKQQAQLDETARLAREKEAAEKLAREKAKADAKKEAAERAAAEKRRMERGKPRPKFDFEKEKPNVLAAIANASRSSNNLVNALQHINRETTSITQSPVIQKYLAELKTARKPVVRYIQLIEQDPEGEFVGTLLSTNEQILAALGLYDSMRRGAEEDSDDEATADIAPGGVAVQSPIDQLSNAVQQPSSVGATTTARPTVTRKITGFEFGEGEVDKLQVRQRMEVEKVNAARAGGGGPFGGIHPDLQDLAFGPVGGEAKGKLPEPIQPRHAGSSSTAPNAIEHGSLSDYSDYSSDEETHAQASASTSANPNEKSYARYISPDEAPTAGKGLLGAADEGDDPFGDPFADPNEGVGTPGIVDRSGMNWASVRH